jgi:hypothetical protein
MSTRPRKRQRTDPLPVKSGTKTLFHFFSKPNANGSATGKSPSKTESDASSINDEPRRKSDIGVFNTYKGEITPMRTPIHEIPVNVDSEPTQFESNVTDRSDSCSPRKEDDIDPFDDPDFQDDEYRDEDFPEDELDSPYEGVDNIEDDIDDVKPNIKQEPMDPAVDEGPSCPFCNFSFKDLSENVPSISLIALIEVNYITCEPMSRQCPAISSTKVNSMDSSSTTTPTTRNNVKLNSILENHG